MLPPVRLILLLVLTFATVSAGRADPLSRSFKIDFFRDVPSRNLQGLATRSDGRLTAGPVLREFGGEIGAELLWSLVGAGRDRWLVGTGPDGRVLEITTDLGNATATAKDWAKLDDAHVYALHRLPDGRVLAGSSPRGGLYLLRDGQVLASARLPVDSIFDLLPLDATRVLVGTGNPGRVYQVDVDRFAASGVAAEPVREPAALAARGITRFGEIRDRNVRRLAQAKDGRVLAGSSPEGNLYAFPAAGGPPELLLDNQRAEITDLRVEENGDVYALVVFSGSPAGQLRLIRSVPTAPEGAAESGNPVPTAAPGEEELEPRPVEKFSGRSALVWLPGGTGFPETLASRSNIALYRIARRGDLLVMAGGDAGEMVGFDRVSRRSLTFGGSASAQLSELVELDGHRFLVLRNNPAGLALLDFAAAGPRRAETRRIDLRGPATLGALRFNRLRAIAPRDLQLALRANRADDEVEGWTPWSVATVRDGAWLVDDLRGRYVQLRLELPPSIDPALEIDTARLFHLPQNRRPVLEAFRIISPNFGLLPRAEGPPSTVLTLGQVVGAGGGGGGGDEPPAEKRSAALLGSQVIPQPGAQIVYWTIDDPDGDTFTATFSIRADGSEDWIDLAVDTAEPWVQFDRSHLADGIYFTRLVVREQGPRAPADRLEVTFEADDLVIDQTPPELATATVERAGGRVVVHVTGRDALSLLAGIEVTFNNGHSLTIEQPTDGILDGRTESFVAEVPASDASGATNVEVVLYDDAGNSAGRRLALPDAAATR